MNLPDFLLARIAEDEAVARAATQGPWVPDCQGWTHEDGTSFIQAPYEELDISPEDVEHVTRWQPARVLADCDARRRIVAVHSPADMPDQRYCQGCGANFVKEWWRKTIEECPTLRALALPYAGHPDYLPEWRP